MTKQVSVLGAGFIGMHMIKHLIDCSYSIRVLDLLPCPQHLLGKVDWHQGDFADNDLIDKVVAGSQAVIHMISSTVPGDRIREEDEIMKDVLPTIQLLRRCVAYKVDRVIFMSSASVYGLQEKIPISEGVRPDPISSHGIQKLLIENYLHYFHHEYGLDYRIARVSNPYGHGQDIYGRQGLISIVIGRLMQGKPVTVRGNGAALRDYIYIDDVIRGCTALLRDKSGNKIFNIGSGQGHSVNDVLNLMEKHLGRPVVRVYESERKADIPVSVLDITKARTMLDFDCRFNIEQGIMETLQAYQML